MCFTIIVNFKAHINIVYKLGYFMQGNNYSFEELMNSALGISSGVKPLDMRITGYSDAIIADVTKAAEDLHFYETYVKLNEKNIKDKMNMLQKIKNTYANNINDTYSRKSLESYLNKNIRSLEDDNAQNQNGGSNNNNQNGNDQNNAENGKKKGQFLKRIITAVINFIKKVIDFIKLVFNKIKTFIAGIFQKGKDQWKLNPKNPFGGDGKDKMFFDFSSFNLSGAKKFVNTFNKLESRINQNSTTDEHFITAQSNIKADAINDVQTFVKKMQSQVNMDIDKQAILWNIYGMKTCDSQKSYQSCNVGKLLNLLMQMQPPNQGENATQGLLPEIMKVNEKIGIAFKPIEELVKNIENGTVNEINGAFVKAGETIQKNNIENNEKINRARYVAEFKINSENVTIANTKNLNDMIKFLKNIVGYSNTVTAIGQSIVNNIQQVLIPINSEVNNDNDEGNENKNKKQSKSEAQQQKAHDKLKNYNNSPSKSTPLSRLGDKVKNAFGKKK